MKASNAQRRKVRGQPCIVCWKMPVDPAHVIPRSMGGCNDSDCVVPLCRDCHRAYDSEGFDLLPYLEAVYRTEQKHAVEHVGIARAYQRITNERLA